MEQYQEILNKETLILHNKQMTRRQFLAWVMGLGLSVLGVSSVMRALTFSKSDEGIHFGPYGGKR